MKFNICVAISLLEGVSSNEEDWEEVESEISGKRSSTTTGDNNFVTALFTFTTNSSVDSEVQPLRRSLRCLVKMQDQKAELCRSKRLVLTEK